MTGECCSKSVWSKAACVTKHDSHKAGQAKKRAGRRDKQGHKHRKRNKKQARQKQMQTMLCLLLREGGGCCGHRRVVYRVVYGQTRCARVMHRLWHPGTSSTQKACAPPGTIFSSVLRNTLHERWQSTPPSLPHRLQRQTAACNILALCLSHPLHPRTTR